MNANNTVTTPYFLSLVKGSKKEDSLNNIVDENGTPFNSDEERKTYIRESFEKLYKIPDDEVMLKADSIKNFLGDVADNPVIVESKLNEQERNYLQYDLTLEELDNSIAKAKTKSAPCADGFSNGFIKEYWHIFCIPLLKLSIKCYAENKLTDTFCSAEIKLIPKKGDTTLLKNWRPISMFNCFYKIISMGYKC